MIKLILAIIFISNTAFGAVCDIPEKIAAGAPSPCAGYVFSDANEQKVRTDLVYKNSLIDNLTKQNAIQSDMLNISAEQIALYKAARPLTDWDKAMYFALGVVVSGVAVYGAAKVIGK